jgi:hypothetical protein
MPTHDSRAKTAQDEARRATIKERLDKLRDPAPSPRQDLAVFIALNLREMLTNIDRITSAVLLDALLEAFSTDTR